LLLELPAQENLVKQMICGSKETSITTKDGCGMNKIDEVMNFFV
jgi:hypothetical protein